VALYLSEKMKQDDQVTLLKQKDFDMMSVALRSDGLMCVTIFRDKEIDVQHIITIVETIGEFGEGKRFPVLIIADENTLPTHEARQYLAAPESDPYALAEAYVVGSVAQKLVGNFYLSFNKPARPTKIFNNEKDAVAWLKTFL
jgi:hypothetical protein